ncbi:MAG: CRISPR-associated endoribonuclease Cas6 [Thermoplasmata archaeon]
MKSIILKIERREGVVIPFEYNYYLGISLYSKLQEYQKEVKPLHTREQLGIHTISNIITKNPIKYGDNGLEIDGGFVIFRSLDPKIITYLRLGLSIDPIIRIANVKYYVKSIHDLEPKLKNENIINFRTISPILVRNFDIKKKFVNRIEDIEKNLNLSTRWILEKEFGIKDPNINIEIKSAKRKTVKISSAKAKESITTAFQVNGKMSGDPNILQILYYKGLGSKTSLALGCWEVF